MQGSISESDPEATTFREQEALTGSVMGAR